MVTGESTPQASAQKRGAVMAFDFGERRIGVAVGDRELGIAHPLETIEYRRDQDPLASIEVLVREWRPILFVVGLPVSTDGSEHELAPLVRSFCEALTQRFGVATRLIDERYTSAEAAEILSEAGIRGRRQKEYLDQVAAQTILEDFFAHDNAIA
ncbi:MAG: Holliday junction resolvase RuvX [Betaproteobacteria bacterium]|nr:MAG: Holliday junction resolvase RuvX [Betaproteobacteria bacterium]